MWDLSLLRNTRVPMSSDIRQIILSAGDRVNLVAQLDSIGLSQVAYADFADGLIQNRELRGDGDMVTGHIFLIKSLLKGGSNHAE